MIYRDAHAVLRRRVAETRARTAPARGAVAGRARGSWGQRSRSVTLYTVRSSRLRPTARLAHVQDPPSRRLPPALAACWASVAPDLVRTEAASDLECKADNVSVEQINDGN